LTTKYISGFKVIGSQKTGKKHFRFKEL